MFSLSGRSMVIADMDKRAQSVSRVRDTTFYKFTIEFPYVAHKEFQIDLTCKIFLGIDQD